MLSTHPADVLSLSNEQVCAITFIFMEVRNLNNEMCDKGATGRTGGTGGDWGTGAGGGWRTLT